MVDKKMVEVGTMVDMLIKNRGSAPPPPPQRMGRSEESSSGATVGGWKRMRE